MTRIMQPNAVAVIGASAGEGKIGNSVMKNLIDGGYDGAIHPIHPKADEILGRKCYPSVTEAPGDIDVAVFCIPAALVAGALAECGQKGIPGAVLIPSGFAEIGEHALQAEIVEVARENNVRLMGPNIYGFYYTHKNLCATFCTPYTEKGQVALSSQSGGVGMAIVGFSRSAKMGVSAIVGLGNKADIDEGRPAHLLRAGPEHRRRRHARRGLEGRPRLRRSGSAGLQEEAGGGAEGGPHVDGRARRQLPHRGLGRRRPRVRRRAAAERRDSRPQLERHAGVRARTAGAADAQGRETC